MKIIGLDPGTARAGWAIIEKEKGIARLLTYGCMTSDEKKSPDVRLLDLFNQLHRIISKNNPTHFAVEDLFYTTNAKTVIAVSQARGVMLLAAAQKSIPVFSYSPLAIKLAVAGYGKAGKVQVQKMVVKTLKLPLVPQPDDAADAVAVALTHCFSKQW